MVFTSKDDQIVTVAPALNAHQVVIAFGSNIDIESVAPVGNVVYAGGEDNSMNAIDLTTKQFIWDVPLPRYENTTLASPQIAMRDNTIYTAGVPGVLTALDTATGATRWAYPMSPSGETTGYYSSIGRIQLTADRVYVGTTSSLDANYLHAIDRATGQRIWRLDLPDPMSGRPQLVGTTLLVPARNLYALDPATGAVKWSFAMEPLSRGASTPSVYNDNVLVQGASAVADGRLYCIDLATGALKWSIKAGNDYAGVYSPLIVNGLVFGVHERGSSQSTTGNGIPFLADIATGAIVWKNPDVSIETSPVWANGRLYFHGQNFKGTGGIDNNVGLLSLDATTGAFVALDNYFRYSAAVTPIVVATNGVFTAAR